MAASADDEDPLAVVRAAGAFPGRLVQQHRDSLAQHQAADREGQGRSQHRDLDRDPWLAVRMDPDSSTNVQVWLDTGDWGEGRSTYLWSSGWIIHGSQRSLLSVEHLLEGICLLSQFTFLATKRIQVCRNPGTN